MVSAKNRKAQRHYKSALYPKLRVARDRITYVRDLTDKKEIIPALNVTIMLIEDILQLYRPRNVGGLPRIAESVRAKVIQLIKLRTPIKIVAYECRISKTAVNTIIKQERLYNFPGRRGNRSRGLPPYHPPY